ncbi:GPI-anchored surface protein, putative [Bodo saltans]|uniref:GPI-anchored surface protein, putative n=1 Tax=Bodo saltans TaxID=75058 RepID=A0A0S4JR39_BODSA|nr:GPI-anchored surface protein, putative [Bodo saltans]|eukprot:CUG93988.1 GPI-anchored surface protein, putative [Bodo saltans]
MNSFVSRRIVVLFLLATGGALSLSDAEAAAGSTIMGSGGDGDQLPQSSNTLLSTSSRSSLVDHPWLETFFSCPSTPPPPSSYQTSRPPDTATLTSVFTDAATSELAPLVVGGVLGAVTLPALAVPLLGVLGFSSAGVAAYSIAAALQTSQVAAGSWFALCQSAGAFFFFWQLRESPLQSFLL